MKRITFLVILSISLISCSNDDSGSKAELDVNDYYGKWISTQYDSTWNDQYFFSKDGTFTRTKTINSLTTNLSGTFEIFEKKESVIH
ncbi:hypothetical protein [Flavobacterium phragmitis]|uniref:Lipocalin-like domain-containing protein n=1 Tax=Flavobacterium phragmitis TaxID=739143 RepID=A0A1I1W1M3_9FLAO|nr:hypothetical protein [Flavobacterium phragmitis]SFD89025.1 hypothetical protein SAMN05216297_11426 [Flavobacterium phragmitis]